MSLGHVIDAINGTYECAGGFVLLLNVVRTYRDKQVRGVNPWVTGFFTSWGLWNLIFYPFVGAWLSFCGGLWLVCVNGFWFGQLYYYAHLEWKRETPIITTPAEIPAQHLKAA